MSCFVTVTRPTFCPDSCSITGKRVAERCGDMGHVVGGGGSLHRLTHSGIIPHPAQKGLQLIEGHG